MSQLALTKLYGDLTLLFKSDIDSMWDELEAKTNGNLDADNVQDEWASWSQVTLDKDSDYSWGATDSGIVRFYSSTNRFVFAHDTNAKRTYFKIAGTEVAQIDTSANFIVKKDIYFYNRSTTYPLSYLIGYQKPVLVYVDGTTINVEQNTATANTTLIVFPAGPVSVAEDVSSTHKFRQLKTSATANGYSASHTGAADSGMKSGVSLTANTWYFVYACIVRGGDDAGNNFILVVDTTSPVPSNWSALDTAFGAGLWAYLGMFRYGHGGASTTTMIPFIQDHQGWHTFTGRAAADNFFGIRTVSTSVTTSTYLTLENFSPASSGDAAPANCSMFKCTIRPISDGDSSILGNIIVTDGSDNTLWNLPSFSANLSNSEAHGFEFKLPNISSIKVKARRSSTSGDDFDVALYISAVLDEWA